MKSTYDVLVELLVDKFQVDPELISPDATFDEMEIDSLLVVELMLVVQSELGIKVAEDTAELSDTLKDAAEAIEQQVLAARAS